MSRNDTAQPRRPARPSPLAPARLVAAAVLFLACAGDDKAGEAGTTAGATDATTDGTATTATGTVSGTSDGATTEATGATTGEATTATTSAGSETASGGPETETESGGDPALEALCLEVQGSIAAGLAGDCACAVEAGESPSVDACLADKGIAAGFGECRCGIVAAEPAMAPNLECIKPIAADFAECIASLGCDDPDALDNCYFLFLSAGECPPSVTAVDAEVEYVCRGAGAFACGSGEEIPDTWLCDLEDDCADGSDESRCPVFECDTGDEIPLDWQCDGAADCPNGDDEVGCDP
ncbi:MAG: LDL receptor domain-containing protein [Nannocystaceae bacterium]